MMKDFVKTAHCQTRVHCRTCRDLEGGRRWRESLRKHFRLPGGKVDFECPFGATLDDLPEPVEGVPEWVRERERACKECKDEDCFIKHTHGCVRRKWQRQKEMMCPKDKWPLLKD